MLLFIVDRLWKAVIANIHVIVTGGPRHRLHSLIKTRDICDELARQLIQLGQHYEHLSVRIRPITIDKRYDRNLGHYCICETF